MAADFRHISVLATEVIQYLAPRPSGIYVDGTLGGAGHARLILEATAPDGLLIGFDRDSQAISAATGRLADFGSRVTLVHKNFASLAETLTEMGIEAIDGFLLDVGVSSHQLDMAERGFSFQQDAPLDMRMDTSSGSTAADLVNSLAEEELSRLIWEYGEERWAKRIAAFIAKRREESIIETTLQLVDVIKGAVPKGA